MSTVIVLPDLYLQDAAKLARPPTVASRRGHKHEGHLQPSRQINRGQAQAASLPLTYRLEWLIS